MLKKILFIILLILVGFAIIAALQPNDFRVTRSATISAPPEAFFTHVNNLHKWEDWSPWAKLDPNATSSFEGPDEGTGAVMKWDGNNDVGTGSMTIVESRPNELVKFRLDFLKPFKGTNDAEFTFRPEGENTVVTWTMTGTKNFVTKAVGLVMNCDKMVGDMFEKGLANLKNVTESQKGVE